MASEPASPGVGGRGKQKVLAGVLGIILGGFGAHHFYLGSMGAGGILAGVFVLGWVTSCLGVGILLIPIPGLVGLVEGIMILVMPDAEFDARYNQRTPGSMEFVFMKPQS